MDTKGLPKYNGLKRCRKCHHSPQNPEFNDAEYIVNKEMQADGSLIDMRTAKTPFFEYMIRRCNKCNYKWMEQCADIK